MFSQMNRRFMRFISKVSDLARWRYFASSSWWHPSTESSFAWTRRFQRCFHLLKQSWNSVALVSTVSLSNWCTLTDILNLENSPKSRMGLYRNCTEAGETVRYWVLLKIAAKGLMNALVDYRAEKASHTAWPKTAYRNFSELQHYIRCWWSPDL